VAPHVSRTNDERDDRSGWPAVGRAADGVGAIMTAGAAGGSRRDGAHL